MVEPAAVVAQGLVKRFGEFTAVDGIDFEVARGEVFGFLGPNGAGKSSTMRMVAAMSPPTAGHLRVLGLDPTVDGAALRGRLGVVQQEDNLDSELPVIENLVVHARYFGIPTRDALRRARELLDFVELGHRAADRVGPLSGGMKRRLVIARGLVNDPDLLLLDEPTTGLDPQARQVVWDRLYRLKQRGVGLLLTTHYMDEAEQLCDRLVVIDGGRIVAQGTPRGLIEDHVAPEVVELRFVGDVPWDVEARLDGVADHAEVLRDRVVLATRDANATLAAIDARDVVTASRLVRRSTLEDVFIALTGRSLGDG